MNLHQLNGAGRLMLSDPEWEKLLKALREDDPHAHEEAMRDMARIAREVE